MFPLRFALLALAAAVVGLTLSAAPASAASYAGAPVRVGALRTVAEASDGAIRLGIGGRFAPRFWPGINLGVTVPGTQPGELAATRADYDRWLRGIGRLGARLVRVYTIQRPAFYDALGAYDRRHPHAPLYLIQGVWIPEDAYDSERDVYAPAVTDGFRREIDDAVAVLHGAATLPATPGHASGRYRADVSRWTLSMLLGIEWDPEITQHVDAVHAGVAPFAGRYFAATPDATPMESWLASMLDEAASRQAALGWSMPLAFVNWVTTDPLRHPAEPLADEDLVSIEATHVRATPAWPGGTYASYHVYPYYPDSLALDPALASAPDPYAAYLEQLRAHHGDQPVMVTEFGVPTGLGVAHRGPLGRDQGGHPERQAGAMDAAMLGDIRRVGLAGGVLFEWIDEWFKRTWNTQDFALPADRRALWRDDLTNEAQFGVLAAEPDAGPVRTLLRARRGPVRAVRASVDARR